MSVAEMARIWANSPQKGNHLLLLLALADNANDAGYCFPGIAYLAQKTRMSERTVVRMLDDLDHAGEIGVIRRRTKGNRYMILSGCHGEEKDRRIQKLSDIANPITAKMSVISDKVVGELPTTINEPSMNHHPVVALLERHFAQTPVGSLKEKWIEKYERGGAEIFEKALILTVEAGGGRKMNIKYVTAIIDRLLAERDGNLTFNERMALMED